MEPRLIAACAPGVVVRQLDVKSNENQNEWTQKGVFLN